MMTPELPEELLEEILCRVPATSLKRLRSTCKQWNRLFKDKKFSKKHFDKATKQFPVFMVKKKYKVCFLSVVNLHSETPCVDITDEYYSLIDHSTSSKFYKDLVFHCDGLLLCTSVQDTKTVIWNPCTGQTKLIQPPHSFLTLDYVLGYSQDKKTSNKSYKILSYQGRVRNYDYDQDFDIYDVSSNSWKNLHVTLNPNYDLSVPYHRTSLKGKTYWFAFDNKEEHFCLISFDYTRERFERLCLPYECGRREDLYISVVKEEKLTVLLQRNKTSKKEIWVSNKIGDETKELSWSKLLEVEIGLDTWPGISFLVDEEKKIVVCCVGCYNSSVITVSIGAEDNDTTQVETVPLYRPLLADYLPSLIQID